MLLSTYVTFSPMAELEARHAIYWLPALAMIACASLRTIGEMFNRSWISWILGLLLLSGVVWSSSQLKLYSVHGYRDAAEYVKANTKERQVVLMEGFMTSTFVYEMRIQDPQRQFWVLRGDKVFYNMISDPHSGYTEMSKDEKEILLRIEQLDPEYIVVEEPQLYFDLRVANLVRKVLRGHPELFQLEKVIPLRSDHFRFSKVELYIYRKIHRNPNPPPKLELQMQHLGRGVETDLR